MKRTFAAAVCIGLAGPPAWAGGLSVDSSACLLRPKTVAQLGSPIFGLLAAVLVDRGDAVAAGQLVARLDARVEDAQLALDRFRAANATPVEAARTDLEMNQRELARRRQLAGNMFSKANELDEIATKISQDQIAIRKAEADQHTAALEAERSASQQALKQIRSPIAGMVTEMKLSAGEYVYETTPIMVVAQVNPLTVDLVVPASRYRAVRLGMVAEVTLEAPVGSRVPAKVDVIDPVIDAASDTFRVRLELPNPENRIPAGVRCSVLLPDVPAGAG